MAPKVTPMRQSRLSNVIVVISEGEADSDEREEVADIVVKPRTMKRQRIALDSDASDDEVELPRKQDSQRPAKRLGRDHPDATESVAHGDLPSTPSHGRTRQATPSDEDLPGYPHGSDPFVPVMVDRLQKPRQSLLTNFFNKPAMSTTPRTAAATTFTSSTPQRSPVKASPNEEAAKTPSTKTPPSHSSSKQATLFNLAQQRRQQQQQQSKAKVKESESSSSDEEEEQDFVAHSDSDDDVAVPSSRKARGPRASAAGAAKMSVSGQKWTPTFRRGRKVKRIEHCPTEQEATRKVKDAEHKAKEKLWPPISDLGEIYADIVDRMPVPLLKPLAETLQGEGRALRVATMCSGTESPLLALNLIARAVKAKWGIKMGIDHVFSCELEPFKQAYIERNFNPPLLFRDVTELGKPRAHTAYGALVDVPGDVDLLVAGTSCVDYSGLNNKKKGINEGGESGRTFYGMLDWVKRHRPAIVILENVKSAPWEGVGKFFEEAGYDSTFSTRFDTKNYYIPQTRQRGYFIATRNTKGDYPANWLNLVSSMQRPASSPIEAFMLPTSDQRIQTARNKLGHEQAGKSRSTIDWSKCQGRHEEARGFERLGQARPFTAWEEGGSCAMSHGAWNEYARPQPERVLDLMDITVLRDAKKGEDPHFKSRVWELSQNVDRNIVAPQPGITGCLTPSGMPFLTSRGGPVTGLEALSLQGLPIDELLLTRENDDQLQNLAGNAMTSTVVGICLLSALVLARPDLEADRAGGASSSRALIATHRQRKSAEIEGDVALASRAKTYDLISLKKVDMPAVLAQAVASSQLCICEGAAETKTDIYRCAACDHTVCGSCKSRPTHRLEEDRVAHKGLRQDPRAFADHLKSALPMRLNLAGDEERLRSLIQSAAEEVSGLSEDKGVFKKWTERVLSILQGAEFRFSHLKRERIWSVDFVSASARLELILDENDPHWKMYVHAAPSEPEGSVLRRLLLQPVARFKLGPTKQGCTLLDAGGPWELNLPSRYPFCVTVTSHGEQVDTWEASLGLRGDFEGTKRYSRVRVDLVDSTALGLLGQESIAGDYELLPECGQANASLHKRIGDPPASQLYFFIEAIRYGSAKDDAYVFSPELGLPPYPTERQIVATLKPGWKPEQASRDPTVGDEELTPQEHANLLAEYKSRMQKKAQRVQTVDCTLCGKWVALPGLQLTPFEIRDAESTIAVAEAPVSLNLNQVGCEKALAVLNCAAPLTSHADDIVWPRKPGHWAEVDLEHHSTRTFAMLAWLMERVPEIKAWGNWMKVKYDDTACSCDVCAPAPPSIQWLQVGIKPPTPIENEKEAAPYEQALKNRPFPFILHLRTEQHGLARARVALNAATLMHRALSRLPPRQPSEGSRPSLAWRMTRVDPKLTQFNLPEYYLTSNRQDPEAANPSCFKLELRKEQKRSLTWMLQQEADDAAPFVEEEVSEATLEALEWCAEGKASQERVVRGGVIADAVGYGKTAISLALIAEQKERDQPKLLDDPGFIPTKATLVIVPPQLCLQWYNEVTKFVGNALKVHVVYDKQDLNKMSVRTLQTHDIVIMSVSAYKSDTYFESLASFAAANPIPKKEGRFFDSALSKSVDALRDRVRELKMNDGGKTLWSSIKERRSFDPAHLTTYKARKRIVGAKYAREKALQDDGDDEEDGDEPTIEDAWEKIRKEKPRDVWGLSKGGLKHWTDLTCPPLEAFAWRRVIIDEFHYIAADSGRVFSAVRALTGGATWVLSGTPRTGDFADIRSMAAFLNVHLGVEDDADYADVSTRGRSGRNKVRSNVERFRNFVEVHSPAWHHRRQALGQDFLNRFVRQNVAEIGEIDSVEILKPVRMPAAERACYLELQHTIEALDLRHARTLFRGPAKAKSIVSDNDRDYRLRTTLGESSSPEEALSRQAAHFVLSSKERAENAIEACNLIVKERAKQLAQCKEELMDKLDAAQEQHFLVLLHFRYRDPAKQALVTFAKNAIGAKYGDKDSKQALATLLEKAECLEENLGIAAGRKLYPGPKLREALERRAVAAAIAEMRKQAAAAAKKGKKPASDDEELAESSEEDEEEGSAEPTSQLDEHTPRTAAEKKAAAKAVKDLGVQLAKAKKSARDDEEQQKQAWAQETHLRALVHQLVQLRNETAGRQRSLRYFENIRKIQLGRGASVSGECPGCKTALTFETLALSSVCGHLSCERCGRQEAWKGRCPEPGCNADAKPGSIVSATSLGVENEQVSAFGEKMSQLAALLRDSSRIPSEDRVILFVQFEGLLAKTEHALHAYGIPVTRLAGKAKTRSETLDRYQQGNAPRVLLLDVGDESAAGSNLTIANHVIFLSSLVTGDLATYKSTLQQAKGRCMRFGQTKEVHVWMLLARNTIDEVIFNERERPSRGGATLDEVLQRQPERQQQLAERVQTRAEDEREAAVQKKKGGVGVGVGAAVKVTRKPAASAVKGKKQVSNGGQKRGAAAAAAPKKQGPPKKKARAVVLDDSEDEGETSEDLGGFVVDDDESE